MKTYVVLPLVVLAQAALQEPQCPYFALNLQMYVPCCRYAVLVDGAERKGGSLFEDFEPAFNPPEEVDDPEDSKPDTWVDTPKCALAKQIQQMHWKPALKAILCSRA